MGREGAGVLEALGIDAAAEAVYRALLKEQQLDAAELGERTGLTPERAGTALGELEALGVVNLSDNDAGRWRAMAPGPGLAPLLEAARTDLERRREELKTAETAAGQLVAEYPRLDVRASSGQFRPLIGVEEVFACMAELARTAREEWLTMIPGAVRGSARGIDQSMLDRGVRGRILWQDHMRNVPSTVEYGLWLTESGSPVRTAPTLPTRMVIVDREVALVPLADPAKPEEGAAVVTSPGMIVSLVALFDQVWAAATPLSEPPAVDEATGLTGAERDLLVLLSQGLTDSAVGKKLGVSERTVSRMVAAVMARLGASSRFEAGLEAARRGWL